MSYDDNDDDDDDDDDDADDACTAEENCSRAGRID